MDKSGSRYRLRSLIIENSRSVSFPRRFTEFSIASLLWFLWAVLWLPIINAGVWFFGYRLIYYVFPKQSNYNLELFIFLTLIITLLVLFNFSIFQAIIKERKRNSLLFPSKSIKAPLLNISLPLSQGKKT